MSAARAEPAARLEGGATGGAKVDRAEGQAAGGAEERVGLGAGSAARTGRGPRPAPGASGAKLAQSSGDHLLGIAGAHRALAVRSRPVGSERRERLGRISLLEHFVVPVGELAGGAVEFDLLEREQGNASAGLLGRFRLRNHGARVAGPGGAPPAG